MASNSGQNAPSTYMDGVSVKIAENYKPPKRIAMVMSYSQRVALNRLIQEPVLAYDFTREETVRNKMSEWKKARTAIIEQRKQRLNQLTQAINAKSWENDSEKEVRDSDTVKAELQSDNKQDTNQSETRIDSYYQTESGILIPKIFNNPQSKILSPQSEFRTIKNYPLNHNPINYSEFESDTSSPFDNMELKIINDLEELAQVLKYDSDDNVTNSTGASQKNYATACPKTHKLMNNYISDNIYISENHFGVDHSVKKPPNGYYYDNYSQSLTGQNAGRDTSIRSVPDIMKSLQADFTQARIAPVKMETPSEPSFSSVSNDSLEDPFKSLTADLQKMALMISTMGFPLPRVARACQVLEGNQKKVCSIL